MRRPQMITVKQLTLTFLVFFSCVCYAQNSNMPLKFSEEDNRVTFGNKVEMSKAKIDTVATTDAKTGDEILKIIRHDPYPLKVNGKPVYRDLPKQHIVNKYSNLRALLVHSMKDELTTLDDGIYRILVNEIVTDEQGKVLYLSYSGISKNGYGPDKNVTQQGFFEKVTNIVSGVVYTPAPKNGRNVLSLIYLYDECKKEFKISNHVLYESDGKGGFVAIP